MKLLTAPVLKALRNTPLGSTDGQGDEAKVLVKFFGGGRYTLLVTEAEERDNDFLLYGWCASPLGPDCDEYGYTLFSEMEAVRFPPFGLPVERDRYVDPGKSTVGELK